MPPRVSKQSPTGPPAANGSPGADLLARVRPVSTVDSGGIKVSLYGRGKTGKTRLISTFPKPVLIVGAEDGTRSVRNVPGVDFIQIILRGWKPPTGEGGEAKPYLYLDELPTLADSIRGSKYRSVGVDTASSLADLYLATILGLAEIPEQKSWGMATREQYGQSTLQLKTVLKRFIDLPVNVAITAHERNFSDEGAPSDLMMPHVGSALSPSAAGWLNGAVEYICQTFIRERTEEKESPMGVGKSATTVKIKVKTGGVEYCLRVGPHPVYMTGFRLPPGFSLPDVIVDPTYDKIVEVINGRPAA